MLNKLRRKFIAIAMLSVSIVLIAIVGTINIANYITTNQALDARLSLIADNGGTFPDMTPGDSGKKLEPKTDQPPAMNDLQKHGISQESPFDTRYFTPCGMRLPGVWGLRMQRLSLSLNVECC